MAKSKKERKAVRAARQAAKAAAAAAGLARPSKSQLTKVAQKAIKNVNKSSSNKQDTQKFISGIISDGRVTQSEAKQAESKGVSLARIEKAQTKSFQPGNVFSKSKSTPGAPGRLTSTPGAPDRRVQQTTAQPAYSPLVIQGSAQKVFNQGSRAAAPAPVAAPVTAAAPAPLAPPPVDPMLEALLAQNELIAQQLNAMPDFESIFAQQAEQAAQQRADDLAQMQQQQSLYMEEMAARQAEQERQRLLTSQTQQANMARSGLMPDFSIGGRARSDMYGTGGFKRRSKIRPATIAQGITPTVANAAAVGGLTI